MIGTTNAVGSGGGFKDTDAILQASAPAGSTVTITKGSVSRSDSGRVNADDSNMYDYVFAIPQAQFDGVNPWTVTATLSGDSASEQIVIGSKKSYHSSLSFWVPAEYQAVAYLESTLDGGQYINTGITLSETYVRIVSDFQFTFSSGTSADSWGTNSGSFPYITAASGTYTTLQPANSSMNPVTKADWHEIDLTAYNSGSTLNYSYIVDSGSATTETSTHTITTSYPVTLYGRGVASRGPQRHKHFKMINSNGVALVDLRACYRKSDNVAGFWDDVSKTFFTNAGTGTFTVGSDI